MVCQVLCKYGVDELLIFVIMQIEFFFNFYVVSYVDVMGLMQVVQYSVGRDVFCFQGKFGLLSCSYLFDLVNNIDIGIVYLVMLNNVYFVGIDNFILCCYVVIIVYNGGVGSVLWVFFSDKVQVVNIINSMVSGDVYQMLIICYLLVELCCYLYKVNMVQKSYCCKQFFF